MPAEWKDLRIDDIPGLTPEAKLGLENGLNGLGRAVMDGINPHLMTEEGVKKLSQDVLRAELAARMPTDAGQRAALEMEFKDAFIRTQLGREDERNAAMARFMDPKFINLRTTIASVTSGTTTYTNVTPALILNEILEYAKTYFWHRQEARVIPTVGFRTGIFPVGASTRVTAYRRTQGDDHTSSSPQMGGHAFTKLPLSASVIITNELLEWGVGVLLAWVTAELGYGMGYLEATDFQTGDDSGNWNGHENAGYTEVTQPTTDEMDGIKKLFYTLPRYFRASPKCIFWASGNTIAAITQLKNPAGYPYFPQPGPLDTLCGKRLLEQELATDGLLFFGDMNRYHIYDGASAGGSTMEGVHLASANSTMLYLHTNNDAGPADTNAFRYIDITVS
jgi:HK97 family phage major capsid protein